ncbi:MAG: hypothetical protein ABI415_07980 [Flavitalea sp.]
MLVDKDDNHSLVSTILLPFGKESFRIKGCGRLMQDCKIIFHRFGNTQAKAKRERKTGLDDKNQRAGGSSR